MPITRIWRNNNQQEISTMLHFRTHSVLGDQYPEFQSEKTQTVQFKSHSCLPTADGNFNGMKNCIFLHFHRQEKGGMRFYFENTPWPVKEGCIRWRVFWNLPENRIGQPIFRDIIYLLRQHSCLPQDNFFKPHKFPKVPLVFTIPGGGISFMTLTHGRHKGWKVIYVIVNGRFCLVLASYSLVLPLFTRLN